MSVAVAVEAVGMQGEGEAVVEVEMVAEELEVVVEVEIASVFRKKSHRSEFSPTFHAATFSSRYS